MDACARFDGERGRPMKEWVVVPAAHERKWANLAEQAFR
jgi:hypothetical protein